MNAAPNGPSCQRLGASREEIQHWTPPHKGDPAHATPPSSAAAPAPNCAPETTEPATTEPSRVHTTQGAGHIACEPVLGAVLVEGMAGSTRQLDHVLHNVCVGNRHQTLRHGGEQPRNLVSGILPDAHVGQANGAFDAKLRAFPLQQLEVGLVEPLHRRHRTQRVLG